MIRMNEIFRHRRFFFAVSAFTALCLVLLTACGGSQEAQEPSAEPRPVKMMTVGEAPEVTTRSFPGTVRAARRAELAFLEQGVAAAKRSVEIAMIQYREGLADFQRVLDTQRSKVQAQDQLTATQGSVLINLIATYKVLGGGWESRSGQDFLPQETLREMSGRTDWGSLLEPPVSEAAGGGSGE